jgi:hypothetical protein
VSRYDDDSPLVRIAQASTSDATLTGFRLMPAGFYSLDARIQLAAVVDVDTWT